MIRPALLLLASVLPASAQPRPAPDAFVLAAFQSTTAEALAKACATLSVDPVAMMRHAEETLAALEAEGFATDTLVEDMRDPSGAIGALQAAFLSRHGLADGAAEDVVCAAGRREVAEGTGIGELLVELGE